MVGMYVGVCMRWWLGCGGEVDDAPPPPLPLDVVITAGGTGSDGEFCMTILALSVQFKIYVRVADC